MHFLEQLMSGPDDSPGDVAAVTLPASTYQAVLGAWCLVLLLAGLWLAAMCYVLGAR